MFVISNSEKFLNSGRMQFGDVYQTIHAQKIRYLGKNMFFLLEKDKDENLKHGI